MSTVSAIPNALLFRLMPVIRGYQEELKNAGGVAYTEFANDVGELNKIVYGSGRLFIKKATSPAYWYANRVGQIMNYERKDSQGYWAREGGTYDPINVIKYEDADDVPVGSPEVVNRKFELPAKDEAAAKIEGLFKANETLMEALAGMTKARDEYRKKWEHEVAHPQVSTALRQQSAGWFAVSKALMALPDWQRVYRLGGMTGVEQAVAAIAHLALDRDQCDQKLRAYVATVDEQKREIATLRSYQTKKGDYWVWQGDQFDNLESLTCPVLIQAAELREIISARIPGWYENHLHDLYKQGGVFRVPPPGHVHAAIKLHLNSVEISDDSKLLAWIEHSCIVLGKPQSWLADVLGLSTPLKSPEDGRDLRAVIRAEMAVEEAKKPKPSIGMYLRKGC